MLVLSCHDIGGTVKNSPILIVNNDPGKASSSLVQEIGSYTQKYDANPMFSVTYTRNMSQSEANSKINAGMYKGILIIPPDYSDSVAKNESTTLTLLTDPSDTTTSSIITNAIRQLFAKNRFVSLNIPNIYGSLQYFDFLIPGFIAFTLFMGSVHTTGSAFIEEKEDNPLFRILMTPVSKIGVVLGKTIYQLIFQLAVAVILILAAYFFVGFDMNGSWLLVALVLVVLILGGVGMGIVMSTIVNDRKSFLYLDTLIIMPIMFLSGVLLPLSSVPNLIRYIAYFLPLTYAIDAMRTVMIKGQGLNAISYDLIILTIFAIITFTLGIRLFRSEA
jgi:ABC-2 type transport system permease protein